MLLAPCFSRRSGESLFSEFISYQELRLPIGNVVGVIIRSDGFGGKIPCEKGMIAKLPLELYKTDIHVVITHPKKEGFGICTYTYHAHVVLRCSLCW